MNKLEKRFAYIICPLILAVVWFAMAHYTFNKKPDLNGDNFTYFIYASSLATGHGYADISQLGNPPTNNFPPGYPLLMTPIRMLTDNIVPQKWLNEVFVLAAIILLYFTLLGSGLPWAMAFVAAFSCLFLPRLWHFSTMMMSEASFLLMSVLTIFFAFKMTQDESSWKSSLTKPWFYLMLLCLIYAYHIRTQGLALIAGIMLFLLCRKRWATAGFTMVGVIVGVLPWMIRNRMLGLGGNRYADSIMMANPWRPEEGGISFTELIQRFFETLKMLVFNALPNTITPYIDLNCDQPQYNAWLYLLGALMVVLIVIGSWRLKQLRWLLIGYFIATFGIISLFPTPSGNRYLTTILPLLSATLFIGIWACVEFLLNRFSKFSAQSQLVKLLPLLLLPLLFTAQSSLQAEHRAAQQKFPIQYTQFFNIGRYIKKHTPQDAVICSRKTAMLYMYSERPQCGYKFTKDARELLDGLVGKRADYVVLDALGYSSTPLYLGPAVQRYIQYFEIVQYYENTHTYLLKFFRDRYEQEVMQQ